MIRFGLLGSTGRLGQAIQTIAKEEFPTAFELACAPRRGEPFAPLLSCDLLIDVTEAGASRALAEWAMAQTGKLPIWVVGTTGLDTHGLQALRTLSARTPVLLASNFSLGVLLLQQVLASAQPLLEKWGFTPTLVRETHHVHKKDKPSGTALTLQRLLSPTNPSRIPAESIREGEAIGRHEIFFEGAEETLSFCHDAHDRRIFARGALQLSSALHTIKNEPAIRGKILEPRDLLRL